MKKLKWIVLAIILVIVAGVGIVLMNLNGIVRRTVETQASTSLDLKTTLASAHVSIFGQSLSLGDLQVGSPSGFSAPHMLALDNAKVNVSIGELRGDPVHIKKVQIDAPVVVLEINGTKMNFQALTERPSAPSTPDPNAKPLKVIIDELTVTNPKVSLITGSALAALGVKDMTLSLPTITLNNVGTGEGAQNGAAIKDVVMQLMATIAAKAADSDQLPSQLKDIMHLNVEQVAQKLGKQVQDEISKQVGKIGGDLGKNLGDAVKSNDPGKAIGDLLGGDKRDKKDTKKKK